MHGPATARRSIRASIAMVCVALTASATGCASSLRSSAARNTMSFASSDGSRVTLDYQARAADRVCDRAAGYCADAFSESLRESLGVTLAYHFGHVPGRREFSSRFDLDALALVVRAGEPRIVASWRFDLRSESGGLIVHVGAHSAAVFAPDASRHDAIAEQRLRDAILERIRIALRSAG